MKIKLSNGNRIDNVGVIDDLKEFAQYYEISLEEAKSHARAVIQYYKKQDIQLEISKKYGVDNNQASAALSISGKIGDATALLIDNLVQDLLAVEANNTTNYSKKRIELFEESHGAGSWSNAINFAKQWHQGRVSKAITMPFDDKGIDKVIRESAELGGFVKTLIAQTQKAST